MHKLEKVRQQHVVHGKPLIWSQTWRHRAFSFCKGMNITSATKARIP